MKIISAGIQRPAVIVLSLTSFLLLSAFQAFAQDNSRASVPNDNKYSFPLDLNQQTITFEAVNPSTQVAGRMTVTLSGAVRSERLWDGQSAVGSHLQGQQQATFSFIPYYPYSPSYSTPVRPLEFAGDSPDDSIYFDLKIRARGSDGSMQAFVLRESVTASEDGAKITFAQVQLPAN
jgi:hypothetical protein